MPGVRSGTGIFGTVERYLGSNIRVDEYAPETGDVGKDVTVVGGKTTWVMLGTYLFSVKKTLTSEFHATLTLDDIRLIKPKFTQRHVSGEPIGVSMPFMCVGYNSIFMVDPRYISNVTKVPIPDLSRELYYYNSDFNTIYYYRFR